MITRPDKFLSVTFNKSDDNWTSFEVKWREELTDDTETWEKKRSETYQIEDLPAAVKADLLSAWNGMKAHRDSVTPN